MNKLLIEIIWAFGILGIGFIFAWIPMLAWNHGVHSVFPSLPSVTYMQAFWSQLLLGSIFSRPQYHNKD